MKSLIVSPTKKKASFLDVTFSGGADFLHTTFNDEAIFGCATFSAGVDFSVAIFTGKWDRRDGFKGMKKSVLNRKGKNRLTSGFLQFGSEFVFG